MKFVLGLVALVFIGLALYVYTGKDHKQPQKQTVHKTVKEVTPSQEAVTSVEKKVSQKVKPVVQHTVKKESLKVESASSEVQNRSNSDGEIGTKVNKRIVSETDLDEDEQVAKFEAEIAEKFSEESTYTGKVYGIEDFKGESLPSSDIDDLENDTSVSLGDWEDKEKTMDNH